MSETAPGTDSGRVREPWGTTTTRFLRRQFQPTPSKGKLRQCRWCGPGNFDPIGRAYVTTGNDILRGQLALYYKDITGVDIRER